MRHSRIIVFAVLFIVIGWLAVGCAASKGISEFSPQLTRSSSVSPGSRHESRSGCWLPGASSNDCGALVSVSGQPTGRPPVELAGVVRLSSDVFSPAGNYVELVVGLGGCNVWTVPVRVSGDEWDPMIDQKTVLVIGCVEGAQDASLTWIPDLLDHQFRVTVGEADGVLVSSDQGSISFVWEKQ